MKFFGRLRILKRLRETEEHTARVENSIAGTIDGRIRAFAQETFPCAVCGCMLLKKMAGTERGPRVFQIPNAEGFMEYRLVCRWDDGAAIPKEWVRSPWPPAGA